jgi:hypothetical protein
VRAWRAVAAGLVAAAGLPAAAAAQSEALLECATATVTPAFRERLADAMLGDAAESTGSAAMLAELRRVSDDCARRSGLAEARRMALFSYNLVRLPRDVLLTRLGDRGIAAEVVDEALDFGKGRSNPVITGALSKPQLEALVAALGGNGIDVGQVKDATWEMVGAYASATSTMWQAQRRLR